MKILLIGSGGREHALALKLAQSPRLTQLYIAPGNPGTAELGINVPILETDNQGLLQLALDKKIDITMVGPETPLVNGIVDLFEANNLAIIGPSKAAAQLEGSKQWAKDLMKRWNIPTASYENFTSYEPALQHIITLNTYPIVIKADGLAAGKGVTVAQTFEEAKQALENCFIHGQFGQAGNTVVIEAFLKGQEASILAFCDGDTVLPMSAAQDHKAIFDGDKGPNTGGMGSYSPTPLVTPDVEKKVLETILKPLIKGMKVEGYPFKGILFAGLMIENGEPSVVEFNARFGDPETQVVLPRLNNDLVDIFEAIVHKNLASVSLSWSTQSAVCVILASQGYPGDYPKGFAITGLDVSLPHVHVVQAGTKQNANGEIITNGGRVLGVVSCADDLKEAIDMAYKGVSSVQFEGKYFRTDIAQKAVRLLSNKGE
jgi:phosphoribosylamine--glycine ligase